MRDLMINPLTKFVREDIRDFKVCASKYNVNSQTQKRDFSRIQERYEEMVSRYASQSKSKDSNTIREVSPSDVLQLMRRKQFNSITLVLHTYKPLPHTVSQSLHSAPPAIESSFLPSPASQLGNSVCKPKSTPVSRVWVKKCAKF